MAFPRRSSRTPRSRYTLGLLLLTAVSLLVLDLPGTGPLDPVRSALAAVFRPVRSAGDTVFEPISNGWKGAFGYDEVKDDNEQLKAKLDKLENQDARIEALEAQVAELEKAAGIDTADQAAVTARVTTGPLNSFDRDVEIDKGKDDDIVKGMAVVTDGGVLGTIDVARSGSSTVELLTESSSSIGIRLTDGALGIVTGQGPDKPLLLTLVDDDEYGKLEENDVVTTSGIDRSAFPGTLIIGSISKIGKGDGSTPPTVEVEPAADLSLSYLKVIKKAPPR